MFSWKSFLNRSVLSSCIVCLLLLGQCLHAADEPDASVHRPIRVVMDNNYPPYIFQAEDGTVQGILADQWRLWQQKTGVPVEIKAMNWADALEGMKAGEFDVIDTVFKTEQRLGWLDFGKPYAPIEVVAFFNDAISGITDVDSLKGFVVAVKEGDAAIDLLRSHGVNNLVLFKGYEAIIQAAKEHKVTVFVIDKPPALYFLYKYGIEHQFNTSLPLSVGEFHRAVRKGNAASLKVIESGFAQISPEELQQIEKKWYGAPIVRRLSLRNLMIGAGIFGVFFLFLFYWNYLLRKAVKERTSDLENSEMALRKSEARYRELVENANSIILRRDKNGCISFVNTFAQHFFGYEASEIIGKNVIGTIVAATDSAGKDLQEMIVDIGLNPERYATNENENICKDGSRVWIAWTNKPLYNSTGEVSEILCVGNDITRLKHAEELLQQEQKRLECVIEGSRLGTWEWNIQNNETVLNETWAQLLGYTLTELMPCNYALWESLVHPDDVARAKDALTRCIEGVEPDYDCEFRMQHRDGHWVWILDRGRIATRDADGKPLSMFGTHTDITTIKRTEKKLQETNELFSLFIKHSPIYAFIKEVTPTESRTLNASDNYQEMIGIPGSAMTGKTMQELFPSEFAAKITADDWLVASGETILHLDEEFNGRHYSTIKFPIRFAQKTLLAGYSIDITDRKQAEESLRESEETFRNIVQASPMGVHLYQLEDKDRLVLTGTNPAANKQLGIDNTGLIGKTIEESFPLLQQTEIPMRYRRAALYGEPWQTERIDYSHGTIAGAFEVHAFQMSPGKVAVLFNDITARKQAEEDKANLQNQLTQAQKMESVGRLAGGVAHDFNNMLGVILGHAELALTTLEPTQPLYKRLRNIHEAAQRSADLTQQLLAFARKQTVAPKVLDLNETLEGMLAMLQRLIGENIDLAWLPGKNVVPVKIDPSQVDQVLVNLTVNARDAIDDTGKITIETGTVLFDDAYCARHAGFISGTYALLAVSDNGCGMDAGMLPHLFEPFFTTKQMGKGTGLGLATVYGIVKQNNGFIHVYSEPGQGTTFNIYLPQHATQAGLGVKPDEVASATRGQEVILLAEDEPMILEMTVAMLETLGYSTLPAATPGEAIRLAREHAGEIHLLMTDVVMPEMNGRDLARNLLSLYPNLKRLFMSGYTANVIAHHGVLDEGVHFIQKPFTMNNLADKLREALSEELPVDDHTGRD